MARNSPEEIKKDSPGVPPNSCPYIDMVISCVQDIANAYEELEANGNQTPLIPSVEQMAKDLLEHIRVTNEKLRDNSRYWYDRYKEASRKKK